MKHFYFCSFITILFSFNSFGQRSYDSSFLNDIVSRTNCFYRPPAIEKRDTAKIGFRCGVKIVYDKPLYIVDEEIKEDVDVKDLDPNDIENITILKGPEATTLFGSRGEPGVIIITTKSRRTIKIKDAESGEPIPAATVDLIYGKHKQHSVRLIADSLGRVVLDKIKPGIKYELLVSNVGYETFTAFVNTTLKIYSVPLQRNYSELQEVVVTSGQLIRCRNIAYNIAKAFCDCLDEIRIVRSTSIYSVNSKDVERDLKIYPNPVSRSQEVIIEFENVKQGTITLRLFSLDGRAVGAKEYEAKKGVNKISYFINAQLAAGTYAIQLIDENNKLIKTEKLMIQ